jgi:hypothetical protein
MALIATRRRGFETSRSPSSAAMLFGGYRAIVVDSSSTGDSFTSDPYASAYAANTVLVDNTISSNVVGGTSLIRTWNGVGGTYRVYKTPEYALADTSSIRRIGLTAGQSYSLAACMYAPMSGSAGSPIIIQGDPGATAATMPTIVCGGSNFIWVNGNSTGTGDPRAISYVTFRKLKLTANNTSTSRSAMVYGGPDFSAQDLVFEYCDFRDLKASDNQGFLFFEICGSAGHPVATVTQCKFSNADSTAAVGNCSHVCTFFSGPMSFSNCDFSGSPGLLIYIKRAPGANRQHTFDRCKFSDYSSYGVGYKLQGGESDIHSAHTITNSFFYNPRLASGADAAIAHFVPDKANQAQDLAVSHCTFADDVPVAFYQTGAIRSVFHSNVVLTSQRKIAAQRNVAGMLNSYSDVDNNVYYDAQGMHWSMDLFGGNAHDYTTLPTWQHAFSTDARTELTANPDLNSVTISSLSTHFTNTATDDYSIKAGSSILTAGRGGTRPGADFTNLGTNW